MKINYILILIFFIGFNTGCINYHDAELMNKKVNSNLLGGPLKPFKAKTRIAYQPYLNSNNYVTWYIKGTPWRPSLLPLRYQLSLDTNYEYLIEGDFIEQNYGSITIFLHNPPIKLNNKPKS